RVSFRGNLVRPVAEDLLDLRIVRWRAVEPRMLEPGAVLELERPRLGPRIAKVERGVQARPSANGRRECTRENRRLIVREILERIERVRAEAVRRHVLREAGPAEQRTQLDAMCAIPLEPRELVRDIEAPGERSLWKPRVAPERERRDGTRVREIGVHLH